MKKYILFFILLLATPAIINSDVQKYKVTVTLTFDKMTLVEATELEKVLRDKYEKSASVDLKLSGAQDMDSIFIHGGTGTIPLPNQYLLFSDSLIWSR